MTNWKRFLMSAAGGSNEYVLVGTNTGGTFNYQQWVNAANTKANGQIVLMRQYRSSTVGVPFYQVYTEKFNPDLTYVVGGDAVPSFRTASNYNRVSSGRPKIYSDNTFDVYCSTEAPGGGEFRFINLGTGASPYGTAKLLGIQFLFSANAWVGSNNVFTYAIGDRAYSGQGAANEGGAIASYKPNVNSGDSSVTQPSNPGHQNTFNSTPGQSSFIDAKPVDPTTQSTDHLVVHASDFHLHFYKLNSAMNAVSNSGVSVSGGGALLQRWSNAVHDATNQKLWIMNAITSSFYEWDYVNRTAKRWVLNFPSGSPNDQANWMALINGQMYAYVGTSGGLYLIKFDPTNPSVGEQSYRIRDTSGYQSGNYVGKSEGFLVDGPNDALGDTDLMYLGFSNFTNSAGSYMSINLAVCKWASIPNIANFNNNLTISSSTVSITGGTSVGANLSSIGQDMYGVQNVGGVTNNTANAFNTNYPFYGTRVGPTSL